MCKKCDTEIKAALDHIVVAALKMARLTGSDYHISSLRGLLFTVLPAFAATKETDEASVAVVKATSTAAELKNQVHAYMESLHAQDHSKEHASKRMEFIDKTDDEADQEQSQPGLN